MNHRFTPLRATADGGYIIDLDGNGFLVLKERPPRVNAPHAAMALR
jgi:hypothetical protein